MHHGKEGILKHAENFILMAYLQVYILVQTVFEDMI